MADVSNRMTWLSDVTPWTVCVDEERSFVPAGATPVVQLTVGPASVPPSCIVVPVSAPVSLEAEESCGVVPESMLEAPESSDVPLSTAGLLLPELLLQPAKTGRRQALLSAAAVNKRVRFCMRTIYRHLCRSARKRRSGDPPAQGHRPKLTFAGQLPGLGSPFIFPRTLATQSALPSPSLLAP